MKHILSIRGLNVSFLGEGGAFNPVVEDLSLAIPAGKTLALVGESGSGKSVTALSIMRLLDSATCRLGGEIELDGQNLLALPESQLNREIRGQRVAMIFQEPMTSLHPLYPVGEQIIEALRAHRSLSRGEAQKQAIALLERVRIPAAAQRVKDYPQAFSGGMRQRVMIAMALALQPKLLIADEPTTALDVTVQSEILDLLKDLQDELGMAMLFITHDMALVAEVADEMLVLWRGKTVERGACSQLFAKPKAIYTRALLASVPLLGSMQGEPSPKRFAEIDLVSGEAKAPLPLKKQPDTRQVVLEVENLSARFELRGGLFSRAKARVHAVENLCLSLHAGETLSLVGESGCGKSTSGKAISRLINASGSVRVSGEDWLAFSGRRLRQKRCQIQMIAQDPLASLNPRMRVGQALMEAFLVHGLGNQAAAKQRADELMQQVGLEPSMLSRYPHEFSGGQRQRLCIARALMLSPKILIADEAVSALDVSVKAQVVNLLLDLQERLGIALLFISHDMALVERISHRIAVMNLGEIVEIGSRADVLENPQHPYTQRLIRAVSIPDPNRRHLRRDLPLHEMHTPIRALDFKPPKRQWREVSPGHRVRVEDQGAPPQ